eukprot:gene27584-30527_t
MPEPIAAPPRLGKPAIESADRKPPNAASQPDDRSVLAVTGPDAAAFLHNIVTANVERLVEGEATYAALLTPQGKILSDFLLVAVAGGFLVDVPADQIAALVKRLKMYKLRSAVDISDRSADFVIFACPGGSDAASGLGPEAIVFVDPRLSALGARAIVPVASAPPAAGARSDYDAVRIALAVPEAGRDFALGDAVPHDVNFDDLNAIDFRKGCYVGQEIVSRMKHRGAARRRLVIV